MERAKCYDLTANIGISPSRKRLRGKGRKSAAGICKKKATGHIAKVGACMHAQGKEELNF